MLSICGINQSADLGLSLIVQWCKASLVAQMVKNLPAMPETQVLSLGGENPEEPGGLQSTGSQRVRHD